MRCKNCKEKFEQYAFNNKYCKKIECQTAKAMFLLEKKKKADDKKRKKETIQRKKDLMTLSDWLKIAQQVFNKYIRERDKDCLCISCQEPPKKKNAGHYYNANNHYNIRFDEDNVHLQCEHCNTFLSGNLIPYRKNLINKIGVARFNQLESKANVTRKFSIEEVKEITEIYKVKFKQLKLEV